MRHIGRQLAALRKLRGLTQEELAKLVGTSQSAICRAERGATVSMATIRRIADALEADVVVAVTVRAR